METRTLTLTVYAKSVKTQRNTFTAFSANINGKWYKVKFTRKCKDVPDEPGVYKIVTDIQSVSVQDGGTYENKAGETKKANDILWIRSLNGIEKFSEDELVEMRIERTATALGLTDADDLPF